MNETVEISTCGECGRLVPVRRQAFGRGAAVVMARRFEIHLEDRAAVNMDLCRGSGAMVPVRPYVRWPGAVAE